MGKATNKSAAPRVSAKIADLVRSAATIGYNVEGSFQLAVDMARAIGANNKQPLIDAGLNYKAGYVARYLFKVPAYAKRWGNMDDAQRCEEGATIYAKPHDTSDKPGRRTELEQKASKAADVSWHKVRDRAGLIVKQPRPPKTSTANVDTTKAPPVDLVKAAPRFKEKAAANDYFATAAAALLATCDKNAKLMTPAVSTAVSDFKAAIAKALA